MLASIWFFFWAKNGGFHFRQGDWEGYKSTVLRRKGANGKTLSGATSRSTALGGGGGSVFAQGEAEEENVGVEARGGMRGKKGKGGKIRIDADVRAYRHEKPARVGGINRAADGSYRTDRADVTDSGNYSARIPLSSSSSPPPSVMEMQSVGESVGGDSRSPTTNYNHNHRSHGYSYPHAQTQSKSKSENKTKTKKSKKTTSTANPTTPTKKHLLHHFYHRRQNSHTPTKNNKNNNNSPTTSSPPSAQSSAHRPLRQPSPDTSTSISTPSRSSHPHRASRSSRHHHHDYYQDYHQHHGRAPPSVNASASVPASESYTEPLDLQARYSSAFGGFSEAERERERGYEMREERGGTKSYFHPIPGLGGGAGVGGGGGGGVGGGNGNGGAGFRRGRGGFGRRDSLSDSDGDGETSILS